MKENSEESTKTIDPRSPYLENAVDWVKKKGYINIKAPLEGYEDPKPFFQRSKNQTITPDITATNVQGNKQYIQIALKSDSVQQVVTKWKFFSQLALMKQGKLFLLAPKGHKAFTDKTVDRYNINATVIALKTKK